MVDVLVAAQPRASTTVAGHGTHPRVLADVEAASVEDLEEALTGAWPSRAPRRLRGHLPGG
ncbi:hypothetical protein GCM10027261_39610 [Geodermatophilus arenarius]|uniref:Uncharacterized protein n=1 Tax=Geodermatophilus arenarius TaxID=1137990 RepID=A0ABV9LQ67_9ACTN